MTGWDSYFDGEPKALSSYGQFPTNSDLSSYLGFITSNRMVCTRPIKVVAYLYGDVAQNDVIFLLERLTSTLVGHRFSSLGPGFKTDTSIGPLEFNMDAGDRLEFRLQAGSDSNSAYDSAEDGVGQPTTNTTFDLLFNNIGKRYEVGTDVNFEIYDTEFDEEEVLAYFDDNIEMVIYLKATVDGVIRLLYISGLPSSWTVNTNLPGNTISIENGHYYNLGIRKTGDTELTLFVLESAGWENSTQMVDIYTEINSGEPNEETNLIQRFYADIQTGFPYTREFNEQEFLLRVNPPTLNSKVFRKSNHDIKIGDQFNIGDTMHKVVQIEDDGDLTVDFVPKLDSIPSTIPDVTFDDPKVIARLADSQTNIIEDTNQRKVINFDWEES